MGILAGKKILVVGLASNRSIAWGCAKALHEQGAELVFTYQNEKLKGRVEDMAAQCGSNFTMPLDVTSDEQMAEVFTEIKNQWGGLDSFIHAVAYAPREALEGDFLEGISRDAFSLSHDISAYSYAAMAKAARPLMQDRNASMLAMTYLGAERVVPNYNLMGAAKASLEATTRYMASSLGPENIRVNAISAGPIRTLAASGISGFKEMLKSFEGAAPLRRCVTIEEVGNASAFLLSDLASAITGEIMYVDAGFNTVGMV